MTRHFHIDKTGQVRLPRSAYVLFLCLVLSGFVWLAMGESLSLRAFGATIPATLTEHRCVREIRHEGGGFIFYFRAKYTADVAGRAIAGERVSFGWTQVSAVACEAYAQKMLIDQPLTAYYWPDDPQGSLTLMLDGAWGYVALAGLVFLVTALAAVMVVRAIGEDLRKRLPK